MSYYPDGVDHLHQRIRGRCLSVFWTSRAKALITEHRAAVWAIAEALMAERALNSEQIDTNVERNTCRIT
jgi:hypothetical protein